MNQTITVIEAIAISAIVTLGWAFIKTILDYIEESAKKREIFEARFKGRSFKTYHKDLWYGDESQDEVVRMLEEVLGEEYVK
jgi:hypothetical protein